MAQIQIAATNPFWIADEFVDKAGFVDVDVITLDNGAKVIGANLNWLEHSTSIAEKQSARRRAGGAGKVRGG